MYHMSSTEERIQQFENMTQADPDNDMAHFSLGGLYLEVDRPADAAASFQRCIQLNPQMSKAYQLAGDALARAGDNAQAAEVLHAGFAVAESLGDVMPRDAIGDLLEQIGEPRPVTAPSEEGPGQEAPPGDAFVCRRTGRPGTQMDTPPMRGRIGEWIHQNITQETWDEWIGQGTKVINELRLDFSREEDQDTYDQHMYEFLGIDPVEFTGAESSTGSS